MKGTPLRFILIIAALLAGVAGAFPQGTAFTYQGRIADAGSPANGDYDLRFGLYAASSGGSPAGNLLLTNSAVAVSNGLLSVTLDFGNVFSGGSYWLEIGIRSSGSSNGFTTLSPRQALTPVPYAIQAAKAVTVTGPVPDSSLSANIPRLNGGTNVFTGAVQFNNAASTFNGVFTGNGVALTNLSVSAVGPPGTLSLIPPFAVAAGVAVGSAPYSVAAADVNGDGWMDLINANYLDNTVSVLTNNGNGAFTVSVSPATGTGPVCVVAADVNGDGWPDLITANLKTNTLTVLTNNGAGGFGIAATPIVGAGPFSVTAADVNGDGRMDLICANSGYNYDGNTLTVLTNNGAGGFGLAATLTVGAEPVSVVAADVNGDGWMDLICANEFDNTLTVLTNNGRGGFVLANTLATGTGPFGITAADVNGDGRTDLIAAIYNYGSGNTLTILTNNGHGGFGLAASPVVGLAPYAVIAADLNGDGRMDLISANSDDASLTVLTNNGAGVFNQAVRLGAGNIPVSVAAADVNADGKLDLISANAGANTLSVLLNEPATVQGAFAGDAAGLTNVPAASLIGRIPPGALAGPYLNPVQFLNAANLFVGSFSGNGAGLTNLSVATPLPTNAALLNGTQTFTGLNNFANRVGLGTTNPAAALDVRGDVKLGTSGQYYAPGGVEKLRVIRGILDRKANILAGSGFTATETASQVYAITFTPPFSDIPAVTLAPNTAATDPAATLFYTALTASTVTVAVHATSVGTTFSFSFIAAGPQ